MVTPASCQPRQIRAFSLLLLRKLRGAVIDAVNQPVVSDDLSDDSGRFDIGAGCDIRKVFSPAKGLWESRWDNPYLR